MPKWISRGQLRELIDRRSGADVFSDVDGLGKGTLCFRIGILAMNCNGEQGGGAAKDVGLRFDIQA